MESINFEKSPQNFDRIKRINMKYATSTGVMTDPTVEKIVHFDYDTNGRCFVKRIETFDVDDPAESKCSHVIDLHACKEFHKKISARNMTPQDIREIGKEIADKYNFPSYRTDKFLNNSWSERNLLNFANRFLFACKNDSIQQSIELTFDGDPVARKSIPGEAANN